MVPRLVPHLKCLVDERGNYLDNVDVGGVLVAERENPWFIAGILNGPVADWIFRRISKPFRGDCLSANKQFIAPLPIPQATDAQRTAIAANARELQRLHTIRRDLLARIDRRLATMLRPVRPETWLFAGLAPAKAREAAAPAGLETTKRRAWARAAYETDLAARHKSLSDALYPGAMLEAELVDGELQLLVDGTVELDRVFVGAAESAFLLAQWKVLASTLVVTERTDGKKLSKMLRTLATPDDEVSAQQVMVAVETLQSCEAAIQIAENRMNEATSGLYGLSKSERTLIEGR